MQLRRVERPHPVNPVRNPKHPEMWMSVQQKRFETLLRGETKC